MRIASITAGAGGMYCGSCMRDNTLATALIAMGHEALLLPTYTPITTDEANVSSGRVFLGGVNVYLQQKSWLFRVAPKFVDAIFNARGLLKWAGGFVGSTDYSKLGPMTISLLRGKDGKQKKEIAKLVDWFEAEYRPDVILLTNALLSGIVPPLREALNVPIWTTLQGDDVFLDGLPPKDREACLELMRRNDRSTAGYLVTSRDYADYITTYTGLPREKMKVVHPGLNPKGHGGLRPRPDRPPTLGFFARFAPEKGFEKLVDAYLKLRKEWNEPVKFRFGGWLGSKHRGYFDAQVKRLHDAGFAGDVERVDCPDLPSKVRFFQSIDVLSVPTVFREPKGLYVLEAWANGVPVVQPDVGAFPELVDRTGGGLIYPHGDGEAHVASLHRLLGDNSLSLELGRRGHDGLHRELTAKYMAEATLDAITSPR